MGYCWWTHHYSCPDVSTLDMSRRKVMTDVQREIAMTKGPEQQGPRSNMSKSYRVNFPNLRSRTQQIDDFKLQECQRSQWSQREAQLFLFGSKKVKNLDPELQESGGFWRPLLVRFVCLMLFACLFRSAVPALIMGNNNNAIFNACFRQHLTWSLDIGKKLKCESDLWHLAM